MTDDFDELTEGALLDYLTEAARGRGEHLVIEERDGQWFAETRTPSGLAGETVPVGDGAAILPDESVIHGVNGPDRRTAMERLARGLFQSSRG
jgi:hypothetical protein